MTHNNKVALVTGAGSGIGRATALGLSKAGVKIGLVDLKDDRLENVKKEILDSGGEAIFTDTDVSDPKRVEQSVKEIFEEWNRIDYVFANAGINGTVSPIEDLSPEDWDQTLSTNLKSTFLTVKYTIPHLKKRGGSIVITSSINGNRKFTGFGMSAYSSSKAAQVAFGKMAALELAQYNIRVNIICPGGIETNISQNTFVEKTKLDKIKIPIVYPQGNHPLGHRSGKAEEVASLVQFLLSDQSHHITGTEIYIDGAESLL
ncbi:SDR family oxidoreductase [Bacillus weihaiensis]|uniref:3-oxoacyl-[acyl-carrier-protein] reductase n=1 Tax=Bacillus weihaiensis TaxID=1547283 RepID=A0A1L3MU15_9BACI|nr:SDR family NAD(P)-dependent oxidoreductase [Bacillus weihaiensis]APH05831.1 3-oxoacyl-[acyl-carrier-protein] reductase [Bacillus weihaiensis]